MLYPDVESDPSYNVTAIQMERDGKEKAVEKGGKNFDERERLPASRRNTID